MNSTQKIGLGLIAAGMIGLGLTVEYSGWVLAVGLFAIFMETA